MVFSAIAHELGRLIRGALPFAIVNNRPQGIIGHAISYLNVDAAIDAGHQLIYVKPSTENYPAFTLDVDDVRIESTWGAVFDGGTSGHAVTVSGDRNMLVGINGRTTPGQGNSYDGMRVSGQYNVIVRFRCPGTDARAYYSSGSHNLIFASYFTHSEGDSPLTLNNDDVAVGNYISDSITWNPWNTGGNRNSFVANHNAESTFQPWMNSTDSLMVGNMSDLGQGGTCTSCTVASNEVY